MNQIATPDFASNAAVAERFLKALASGHRLMILCELQKAELSVSALQQNLGLRQSSLSQHLARLRADGLVKTRRESQTIYYSLADERGTRVIELLCEIFTAASTSDDKHPTTLSGGARRPRAV